MGYLGCLSVPLFSEQIFLVGPFGLPFCCRWIFCCCWFDFVSLTFSFLFLFFFLQSALIPDLCLFVPVFFFSFLGCLREFIHYRLSDACACSNPRRSSSSASAKQQARSQAPAGVAAILGQAQALPTSAYVHSTYDETSVGVPGGCLVFFLVFQLWSGVSVCSHECVCVYACVLAFSSCC